ncbi:MAG: hypothetical protein EA369_03815 [Bradymonadales bacterium]|nr:MAG: hypothetical protein EA369_03815 [Bradymonadales bacterium]
MMNSLVGRACFFLLAVLLMGCEGSFTGDPPENPSSLLGQGALMELDGPYQVKDREFLGQRYLIVMNTAEALRFRNGGLIFYEIEGADTFSRRAALDLKIPPFSGDFEVYEREGAWHVFVTDRRNQRLRVFIWDAIEEEFEEALDADGNPFVFETFRNPREIILFTDQGAKDYLAISHFSSGTLQFFDLEEFRWFDQSDLVERFGSNFAQTIATVRREELVGASFRMEVENSDTMNLRGASGAQRAGFGINPGLFLGGDQSFFVYASNSASALFGFRFESFVNSANLLWNLRAEERGFRDQDGNRVEGSQERGFRGISRDGENHIFAASRADNRIYRVPSSEFDFSTNRNQNTRAYNENAQNFALQPQEDLSDEEENFVIDREARKFPRLGDLTVNGRLGAVAADLLWVLSYEARGAGGRGFEISRLYQLELLGDPPLYRIANSFEFAEGDAPQKLLLLEDLDRLVVSGLGSHEISVFDALTMDLLFKLE